MNHLSLDALIRALSLGASRRRLLAGPLGGALAPILLGLHTDDAAARKKCKGNKTRCKGKCVKTATNPRHCGRCNNRCPLNTVCDGGECICQDCGQEPTRTCCPPGGATICICWPVDNPQARFADPTNGDSCTVIGCPPAQQCLGPGCQACCPPGSTCDTSTGTCLR
jgi:hypothetical protein